MRSLLVLAVLAAACGKGDERRRKLDDGAKDGSGEVIRVPGPVVTGSGGAPTPEQDAGDNPAFHLHPDEGTLSISPAEGPAGSAVTATLKVTPAARFHVSTEFNIKLALEAPSGVTLDKPVQTAGGRRKLQGDAQTLSEKELVFAVRATAATPGTYEIKGRFDFGVCEGEACHMKNQPITITVTAK